MVELSEIRVTYSGLISFVTGLGSVITGLIFTLILTRELSQQDFGTWALIGSLTAYVLILRPIVSYWSVRDIARGKESGNTAITSTGMIVIVAVSIYLLIAYFFGIQTNVSLEILLLAGILIPVEFFHNLLAQINLGFKPQNMQYGIIIFEFTKIAVAIGLIYYMQLGLIGVILAVLVGNLASIAILSIKASHKIRGQFQKKLFLKWLKLFWIPTYPNISQILTVSDVTIFTLITGSVHGLAYWAAANTVSRIVRHATRVNVAIYPKLLGGGKKEYLQTNLIQVFYFAFPLTAISIVFAKPALFALNPLYAIAAPIVLFLVPMFFLRTLTEIFYSSLQGIEKVDTNENSTFKDYIKSKLFYLPTLRNINKGIYLATLVIVLLLLISHVESDLEQVQYWALIALITQIPIFVYLGLLIRREFSPKIDLKLILKYFLESFIAFGLVYWLMEQYLEYEISIFTFLPNLMMFVLLGTGIYLGITYVSDKRTRKIFKMVFSELSGKKNNID